jgi:hypothetical protein
VVSRNIDTTGADKENQGQPPSPMSITLPDSGSLLPLKLLPPTISQTQWSRQHWLRLDELLQQRRKGALQFQLQYGGPAARRGKSGALLGKVVTAQGETMQLEQWHLDIIDAFKAEVGGGEETMLAKRLFALLVGEERRRTGKIDRAARDQQVASLV